MEFKLDEPGAREWLARLIANCDDYGDPAGEPDGEELGFDLSGVWDPRVSGGVEDTSDLVHNAIQYGYLTCPDGLAVDVDSLGDTAGSGEDGYRWLVYINEPSLILASHYEGARRLGEPGAAPGLDAAIGVLREARDQANVILTQLRVYVQAASR
jgi:hypothetical protein